MVLEFIPGGELFTHLRKAGKFSNDQTRFYAAQIVMAVQCLHAEGVVYRDLKPENLLLDDEGYLKITDFGFAKYVEDRTWTLCGTPEYLAPEIIQSKGHGRAVDWWALGIIIYEMLAGYPPFYDENPFGIYQKILSGKLDFARHFETHARDLVRKLLTADRTKRIGNLKNGAEDIKKHKWFRGLNWAALYNKQIPAPIVPEVEGPSDTRHYDKYADSTEESGPLLQVSSARRWERLAGERALNALAHLPTHSRARTTRTLATGDAYPCWCLSPDEPGGGGEVNAARALPHPSSPNSHKVCVHRSVLEPAAAWRSSLRCGSSDRQPHRQRSTARAQ